MGHIPDILTTEHFSEPEMQIMVRDGVLKRVGYWYAPIAVPDTVRLRATGVHTELQNLAIADTYTAAWIYKCSARLPHPLTASLSRHQRSAAARRVARVREVTITDPEYLYIGSQRVTTPLRTFRDFTRIIHHKGEPLYNLREERRGTLIAASLAVAFGIDTSQERNLLRKTSPGPYTKRSDTMLARVESILAELAHLDARSTLHVLAAERAKLPGFKLY